MRQRLLIAVVISIILAVVFSLLRVNAWLEVFEKHPEEYPQKVDLQNTIMAQRWGLSTTLAKDTVHIGVISASILVSATLVLLPHFISWNAGLTWLQSAFVMFVISVCVGLFNLFNITLKLNQYSPLIANIEKPEILYLLHFQIFFLIVGVIDLLAAWGTVFIFSKESFVEKATSERSP